MPDTETPRAGTRGRRIARSPPALQESRSRQRQDRRPLFPSRPPPAAHARRHPGPDGPVPARRGPQRALPQAWAPAYRRGVGLGPRTRRPGADTPRAVVPPSPGTKAAPPCPASATRRYVAVGRESLRSSTGHADAGLIAARSLPRLGARTVGQRIRQCPREGSARRKKWRCLRGLQAASMGS